MSFKIIALQLIKDPLIPSELVGLYPYHVMKKTDC